MQLVIRRLLILFLLASGFSSCRVLFPNELFKTTDDYYYFQFASREATDHVISPGDQLSFQLYTKGGFQLIDIVNRESNSGSGAGVLAYEVRLNGFVELPIIGQMHVAGKTRLELEELLEEHFSSIYNDPFIILEVINRRAFVFFGVGQAYIVNLPYEHTSLIEVIATAGGISENNKSYNIKILRGDYNNPEIIMVDLSKLSNLPQSELIIMANDIIIIEPIRKVSPKILALRFITSRIMNGSL